jgi:putative flippase GtrA
MTRSSQRPQLWQLLRYLLVGGFNTCFGYGLFVAFNYLFRRLGVYGSEIASLLSNVIAITAAFLGYKWFVFRTHGSYLREWLRCMSVYGSSMLFSLIMLPPLTLFLRRWFGPTQMASNLAAAILIVVTVIASYFGHKHFSFRRSGTAMDAAPDRDAGKAVESRP